METDIGRRSEGEKEEEEDARRVGAGGVGGMERN